MFSKDNEILDIDNTIAPGHRANVTQGIICAPMVHHDAHILGIHNSVAIEVNDGDDWRFPEVVTTVPAGAYILW